MNPLRIAVSSLIGHNNYFLRHTVEMAQSSVSGNKTAVSYMVTFPVSAASPLPVKDIGSTMVSAKTSSQTHFGTD